MSQSIETPTAPFIDRREHGGGLVMFLVEVGNQAGAEVEVVGQALEDVLGRRGFGADAGLLCDLGPVDGLRFFVLAGFLLGLQPGDGQAGVFGGGLQVEEALQLHVDEGKCGEAE